jgi:hypothetical protein
MWKFFRRTLYWILSTFWNISDSTFQKIDQFLLSDMGGGIILIMWVRSKDLV